MKVQGRERRKFQPVSPGHLHEHLVATGLHYIPVCKPEAVDLCLCLGSQYPESSVHYVLTLFDNAGGHYYLFCFVLFLSASEFLFVSEFENILSLLGI